MANRRGRRIWVVLGGFGLSALAALGLFFSAGCGGVKETAGSGPAKPTGAPSTDPGANAISTPSANVDAKWKQPFAEATREVSPEEADLPAVTTTGKSVGKLHEQVRAEWLSVSLVDAEGKPTLFKATIETSQGVIEIELHPEWAANHVRNFIVLAKIGYYDGLQLDQIVHQVSDDAGIPPLDYLDFGCPVGQGTLRLGSLGYWLLSEISKDVKHEEGSVGACHGYDLDTAGCRFYINLGQAPTLDDQYTIFGKVVKGMDIAKAMAKLPVVKATDEAGYLRPEKPVIMQKVTIQQLGAVAGNDKRVASN